MQRTSSQFVGCVYRQPFVQQLLSLRRHLPDATGAICCCNLATRGSSRIQKPTTPETSSSTSSPTATTTPAITKPTATATATAAAAAATGAAATGAAAAATGAAATGATATGSGRIAHHQMRGIPAATSTSGSRHTVGTPPYHQAGTPQPGVTLRPPPSAPMRIMREENMWQASHSSDTKWLRPRDPQRYRPDFAQTEPVSLRKQFMRSPDERTRDALSRDWNQAMRVAKKMRLQFELAARKHRRGNAPLGDIGSQDEKDEKKAKKRPKAKGEESDDLD